MALPHPGSSVVRQPYGTANPLGCVAIVLQCHDRKSAEGKRFYGGTTADVLMLPWYRELPDVIVTELGGGPETSLSIPLKETDEDLRLMVRDAIQGLGFMPDPHKGTAEELHRWGSWVIVQWLQGGAPYIATALAHPASTWAARGFYDGNKDSVYDLLSNSPNLPKVQPDDIEAQINAKAMKSKPDVPQLYAKPPLRDSYMNGWRDGYGLSAFWAATNGDTPLPSVGYGVSSDAKKGEAQRAGYDAGIDSGKGYGLWLYSKTPPPDEPQGEVPSSDTPVPDGPADTPTSTAPVAQPSGQDWVFTRGGSRFLVREDGITINTKGSGRIDINASADGVHIEADGTEIVIKDGKVALGSSVGDVAVALWPQLKAYLDGHTHLVPAAPPPGPTTPPIASLPPSVPAPDCGSTKTTAV